MNNLKKLEDKISDANTALDRACNGLWPVGSHVRFVYSSRQINASTGTIRSWRGGEACIEKDKQGRGRPYKWRHWTAILPA